MRRSLAIGIFGVLLALVVGLMPTTVWYRSDARMGWRPGQWMSSPRLPGSAWASGFSGSGGGAGSTNTAWLALGVAGESPASRINYDDATTYHLGIGGYTTNGANIVSVRVPESATLTAAYWSIDNQGVTSAETVPHQVNKNASSDTTGVSIAVSANGLITGQETGLSVSYSAGDRVAGTIAVGTLTTNPTNNATKVVLRFTVP